MRDSILFSTPHKPEQMGYENPEQTHVGGSVKHWTLDLGSGHALQLRGLQAQHSCLSLSLRSPPHPVPRAHTLSQINKILNRKNKWFKRTQPSEVTGEPRRDGSDVQLSGELTRSKLLRPATSNLFLCFTKCA